MTGSRRAVLAGAVASLVLSMAVVAALAVPHPLGAAATRAPSAQSGVVVLPTGDAVRVRTVAGKPRFGVVPADSRGVTGHFTTARANGHTYVVPSEAQPFLGSLLDLSLFDIDALRAAQARGRVAVTLDYRAGVRVHVPGLTVTARSGTQARGYLATDQARAFRTALVAQWRATTRPGGRRPATLFGGVTHLAVAGAAQTATPKFPQVTLVVRVRTAAGRPAPGGLLLLMNTDDARKYNGIAVYENGEARVSVPRGNYSGITDVDSFNPSTGRDVDRLLPVADVNVSKNLQQLTLDASQAIARPAVHTPRPAKVSTLSLEFDRTDDADQGGMGLTALYGPDTQVLVRPTGSVRHGSLDWVTTWALTGAAASGARYSYDVSLLDEGLVPAYQNRRVATFQLATIHARYYADARVRRSQFVRSAAYPFQFGTFAEYAPLRTPAVRTEYVYGAPSASWLDSLLADPTNDNPSAGEVDDDFRTYAPGAQRSVDWLRGPLAPGLPTNTPASPYPLCYGCRNHNTLSVFFAPFTDTTPGHVGNVDDLSDGSPGTRFSIYRDGKRVFSGPDYLGAAIKVPAASVTYRIAMLTDRRGDKVKTSTSTRSSVTFRSAVIGGATAPAGWDCGFATSSGCTVLRLLQATIALPTDLSSRMRIGTSTVDFTIRHVQGAPTGTITGAQLWTSRTNGRTFTRVPVTRLGNGRYRATLTNPRASAGRPITLRVHGTDSAGGAIWQTVHAAYFVASS